MRTIDHHGGLYFHVETHSVELGDLLPGEPTCVWEQEVLCLYLAVLDHYFFLNSRRLIRTIMHFLFDNQICTVAGTSGQHDVAKCHAILEYFVRLTLTKRGWHGTTCLEASYIKSMFTHR